jgi:signal transduction histidine kinase
MIPEISDEAFLKTLKVLYVEDEPDAREEICSFLRRRVGALAVATQGKEGLAEFQAMTPDLIVTDIQMPLMDGLALAKAIRDLVPSMPIIVTTAFEQTDYLMRAIELGIDHYVLKPVQAARLESALLSVARRLQAQEQLEQKRLLEVEVLRLRHQASISLLLGGIAHDYNNLLQGILASQEFARARSEPGSPIRQILDLASEASDQVRLLSRRLISLANPLYQVNRVGSIEGLLRSTVESVLAGSRIQPEFDLRAEDPVLRYDEGGLRQALSNLLANAKEAMPDGGLLHISTRIRLLPDQDGPGLPPGRYLHLSLRDSGKGISPEDLPMIFKPYFTTKVRGHQRGTGLGLAVCEAIVQAHGGSIDAESSPGGGSTFHVLLPLAPLVESV